ncbi:MAG: nucleoid occlusion protein [Negativicutes bacterium]|nr:nucleoid occlusion protein [Negativicutes bacterium]
MKSFARFLGIGSDEDQAAQVVIDNVAVTGEEKAGFKQVPVGEIVPNPYQPRKLFYDEALQELADSIREHGVIQPLLVRRKEGRFELIAGERRLRASKIAGLQEVPVIIKEIDDKEMAELAMLENLQREDLHFLEEAQGFQHLISQFGFTQEELARRLGKKQSTIANKLRLLKLSGDVQTILVDENLTERHARALLKVEDEQKQKEILNTIRQKNLNVRETEELIEEIIEDISREMSKKGPKQSVVRVIRDIRIFVNTINSVVAEMKKAGLKVKVTQNQDDDYITINLRIPKRR